MTALELSNLCVLLEKYLVETDDAKDCNTEFYGEIFIAGSKKLNPDNTPEGSVKFYDMCLVQKLHDGTVSNG